MIFGKEGDMVLRMTGLTRRTRWGGREGGKEAANQWNLSFYYRSPSFPPPSLPPSRAIPGPAYKLAQWNFLREYQVREGGREGGGEGGKGGGREGGRGDVCALRRESVLEKHSFVELIINILIILIYSFNHLFIYSFIYSFIYLIN